MRVIRPLCSVAVRSVTAAGVPSGGVVAGVGGGCGGVVAVLETGAGPWLLRARIWKLYVVLFVGVVMVAFRVVASLGVRSVHGFQSSLVVCQRIW